MRHRPHLLVEGSWETSKLQVSTETSLHLTKVLRLSDGGAVSYTNGRGVRGVGTWTSSVIERGDEETVEPVTPIVTLAVAAPKAKDRQRFIVEKAQELGVRYLVWIETAHGEGRAVSQEKSSAWARGALEQSRGAWITEIRSDVKLVDLSGVVMLDAESSIGLSSLDLASHGLASAVTLAVGPEGGFSSVERESASVVASVSRNVLRTETAAVVAAALVLAP